MKIRLASVVACFLYIGSHVHGAIITNVETDIAIPGVPGSFYSPTFSASGPSSTDLLHGLLPSDVGPGDFARENSTGLPVLTDGSIDTVYRNNPSNDPLDHVGYATAGLADGGQSVTYSLGGKYDLAKIVVFGGWNDGGRDEQDYEVLVSTNNGATFTLLGSSGEQNPGIQNDNSTPVSTRIAFTDDTSNVMAAGVTDIRLNFLAVENNYSGYSEIDVFAVPEPASFAFCSLGLITLIAKRRKS